MILLLIKYKYVYCFYLLHEEPCNVDVANKPLLLFHYYFVLEDVLDLLYRGYFLLTDVERCRSIKNEKIDP